VRCYHTRTFLQHRQKLEWSFNPNWRGWRFLVQSSLRVTCSAQWGWTSYSRGYYWRRAFVSSWWVLAATLASQVFGFLIPSLTPKEYPSCFGGSRRCPGPPCGGCGGPMARRLRWTDGAEAHVTTQTEARSRREHAGISRRLPHRCDMRQCFICPQKTVS
jgi:hypothetical protein